jgi:cytochrome d ubiquinol oxidase subunit II
MSIEEIVAGLGVACVIAYALTGGADFGGGIWDMFARGPRRREQRAAIARAMGPVWEANHVWLIYVIILLFTAFPSAYAALGEALFIPFHLVLLGITLRGAAFVFRARSESAEPWGSIFGAASVATPVLLGTCMGAVSEGQLRWWSGVSLLIGLQALSMCGYLAAVYLIHETRAELQEDFRKCALGAWAGVLVLGAVTLPVVRAQAAHLFEAFSGPVLASGVATALLSGWALWKRRYWLARLAAVAQVVLLIAGWALAQYPYLIYPSHTVWTRPASEATLRFVVFATPFGAALLIPSLWFLFAVFKRPSRS